MWSTMGSKLISGYRQWALAIRQEWTWERWASFGVLYCIEIIHHTTIYSNRGKWAKYRGGHVTWSLGKWSMLIR